MSEGTFGAGPVLPEPPAHVLDEDATERRQIRQMLALSPAQRLRSLTNIYRLHARG